MVNWVRTIEMLDGDRKMTIKFHDREVNKGGSCQEGRILIGLV